MAEVKVCGEEYVKRYDVMPVLQLLFEKHGDCLLAKLPVEELVERLLRIVFDYDDDVAYLDTLCEFDDV